MNIYEAARLGAEIEHQKYLKKFQQANKLCKFCQKPLTYEKRWNIFCDSRCMAFYWNSRRAEANARYCVGCAKRLNWWQTKYCSNDCQHKIEYLRNVNSWKAGEYVIGSENVPNFIKKYLILARGEKCERCGWCILHPVTKRICLEVDHVDGNFTNWKEKNLRLLCPNCHVLTPTYGALNRGRLRKRKSQSYRASPNGMVHRLGR